MTDQQADDRRSLRRSESWARHVLDIPAAAAEDVVRHTILTRLAQSQLVPPEPWHEAACLLADPAAVPQIDSEGGYAFYRAAENAMRRRVAALCRRFFDLSPAKRRAEWAQLKDEADCSPPLAEHLDWLEAGLDVEIDRTISSDAKMQELIDHIAATFALPAPMRAAADFAFFEHVVRSPLGWRDAVRQLGRYTPQVAAIGRAFLNGVNNLETDADRSVRPRVDPYRDSMDRKNKATLATLLLVCAGVLSLISHLGPTRSQRETPAGIAPLTNSDARPSHLPPSSLSPEPFDASPARRPVPIRVEDGNLVLRRYATQDRPTAPPLKFNPPTAPWTPLNARPSSPFEAENPARKIFGPDMPTGYQPFATPAPPENDGAPWRR